jgi:tetratricopeptide (TPR) repeat protein
VRAANRQPEAARSAYTRALALAPALLPAQLNLARLDAAEGRVDAARRRLGDLLRKDAGKVQALTELGRLERVAGHLAEARRCSKGPRLAPADQAASTELLALYQQLGDAPAALRVAKQLAQARPDDPPCSKPSAVPTTPSANGPRRGPPCQARPPGRQRRRAPGGGRGAAALRRRRRRRGGERREGPCRAAGPSAGATLQVEAELAAGALERAEALQAAFARRTGNGAEARRLAGDIAMRRGQPGVALAAYRAGFERAPSSALALRAFAAAFKAGQGAEGVSLIEAWLRRQPDDLAARAALAEGSLRLDRLPAARAAYELLLAREPGNASAANNLAQVLLRQNDERADGRARRALAPDQPRRPRHPGLAAGLLGRPRRRRQDAPRGPPARARIAGDPLSPGLGAPSQRPARRRPQRAGCRPRRARAFDSEAEARQLRRELGV